MPGQLLLFRRLGTGLRGHSVLLCCAARNADGADNFAVLQQRQPAFEWSLVILSAFLLVCPVLWGTDLQAAEKFPNKPVTFIIPIKAGGGGDIQVRPLAAQVGTLIGQPLVVVNKPGAGSSIGYREIHDSKPNGYTFGVGMATIVANKLQGLLPYDFRDFTMLGGYQMAVPALMASTKGKRNFKTLQELVEFAKKHPDEVTAASGGKGQTWWIASVEFFNKAGIKVKIIPQEGAGGFSVAQVAGAAALRLRS